MRESRGTLVAVLAIVIAAGLVWRLAPMGLSPAIKKYGGSLLWGAMWHLLVMLALPRRSRATTALAAFAVCFAIEVFKLVHVPWLDALRATLVGQLTLGRVFDASTFPAYLTGIALIAVVFRQRPQTG